MYKQAQALYDSWKHGKRTTASVNKRVRQLIDKGVSNSQEGDLLMVLSEMGISY